MNDEQLLWGGEEKAVPAPRSRSQLPRSAWRLNVCRVCGGAALQGGRDRASPASPSFLALVERQLILEWVQGHKIGREQSGIKCLRVEERRRTPASLVCTAFFPVPPSFFPPPA